MSMRAHALHSGELDGAFLARPLACGLREECRRADRCRGCGSSRPYARPVEQGSLISRRRRLSNPASQATSASSVGQRLPIAAPASGWRVKGMVGVWKEPQRRPSAERFAKRLELAQVGERVARPLQEQHGDANLKQMVAAIFRWASGCMQRKSKKRQPANAGKRLDRLRLGCHPPAERFPAGDKPDIRLQTRCFGNGGPNGVCAAFGGSGLFPPRSI